MNRLIFILLWILFTFTFVSAQTDTPTSSLLSACRSNNLTGAQESLVQGADVNATDPSGSTPLLYAVTAGNREMTELLLEKGARLDVNDSLCRCPVMIAVQKGNVEILKTLAAHGGDLHHRHLFAQGQAQTPLQVAVQNEDLKMVRYLLSENVSTETRNIDLESPLMLAAGTGNLEMVKLLVENGAYLYATRSFGGSLLDSEMYPPPPAIKRYLQEVEQKRRSAAEEPAWTKALIRDESRGGQIKPDSIAKYLQQGGDPRGKDKEGRTLLHYAASTHVKKDLIESLLAVQEIDVNAADIYGMTALHTACAEDRVDNVKTLLEHGAAVDARDYNERTPLIILAQYYYNGIGASEEEEVPIARMLLDNRADVNAADAFGNTPLLYLAHANMDKHLDFSRLLIEHGADVNRQNYKGNTFLHEASEMGTAAMMKLVIEAGADLNARNYYGRSIVDVARYDRQEKIDLVFQHMENLSVQQAVNYAQPAILDRLIQDGADINQVTDYDYGATALIVAAYQNNPEMAKKVLALGAKIDVQDTEGNTALHYAAQFGRNDMVFLLLEEGANVEIRNTEGWRALDLAGTYDRYRAIQLFKDKYPDMEISKQPVVARQEQKTEPESQEETEAEVRTELIEPEISEDQMREQMIAALASQVDRPLHKAVIQGDQQTVEQILQKSKEDVNGIDNLGSSALMYAVHMGHLDIAKLLIENGASAGFQSEDGMDALHLAILSGRKNFVEMLLEAGADPSSKSQAMGQINALEAAMMTKQEEIVELIRSKAPDFKADPEKFAMTFDFETTEEPALDPNQIEAQMRQEERKWQAQEYLSRTSKPLHIAVIKGNADEVKKLLAAGADVHEIDEAGILSLTYAILMENREMVTQLLENGADINRLDSNVNFGNMVGVWGFGHTVGEEAGWGAIHYATVFGSKEMLEFLISKGANVNLADIEHGESPIFLTVDTERPEMLKALVNAGADLKFRNKQGETILHSMARRGKIDYIKLLLELGADIDVGKPGTTPLMTAVRAGEDNAMVFLLENGADINMLNKNAGNIISSLLPASYTTETLKLLIEYGIDVNAKNSKGQPPLFCLFNYGGEMKNGLRDNVQLLLNAGLDISATDKDGNTTLHSAAMNSFSGASSLELAKMLIAYGADVNQTNAKGQTPLNIILDSHANSSESKELMRLLAENNTHLNDKDRYGRNTLHNAAIEGWADIVTLLASKGADIENRTNDSFDNKTPLHSAIQENHPDVVKALLDLGADLEARDNWQETPLITAVWVNQPNLEIIQLLLDHQADCNAQQKNGQTPLHFAVEEGNREIVELLLKAGARTDIPDRSKTTAPELARRRNKPEILELFQ